jgi:hypothetical protein
VFDQWQAGVVCKVSLETLEESLAKDTVCKEAHIVCASVPRPAKPMNSLSWIL